jgi:UDP-N-acetylmuramate dehydrogenase
MPLRIEEQIPLASLTTLGVGGPARYLLTADTAAAVAEALAFARERQLRLFVLGGGSNVVASDRGFDGVVLRPALTGITAEKTPQGTLVTAGAGEAWDTVVRFAAERGLAGIECLSGIPGSTGATPIQNVGAYGQEVGQTIQSVEAVDRVSGQPVCFAAVECGFGYRRSRFKTADAGRYVVTAVRFLLRPEGVPTLVYPELRQAVEQRPGPPAPRDGAAALLAVRETVLSLRRGKSMIVDPADLYSRSAGSFFMNPVLDQGAAEAFRDLLRKRGLSAPLYPAEGGTKISAAWLVEHAGFPRGTRRGDVGVSGHHALALVNYGGTAAELLSLAAGIREAVSSAFGIELEMEPVILE